MFIKPVSIDQAETHPFIITRAVNPDPHTIEGNN